MNPPTESRAVIVQDQMKVEQCQVEPKSFDSMPREQRKDSGQQNAKQGIMRKHMVVLDIAFETDNDSQTVKIGC